MNAAPHYDRHDDGLDSEEEKERYLSEMHGEAADDSAAPKRKRANAGGANVQLTEEDAAAAKEFEEKMRRKKARPALQPADLKSSKGLIYVRRSFPTKVKKFREDPLTSKRRGAGVKSNKLAQKLNSKARLDAAAVYSRSLMTAYTNFAWELFPTLAAEDVFLKIEDLGSKKEVRDYLQIMRDEVRNDHLKGVYGEERAARILRELEYGMKAQHYLEAGGSWSQLAGGGGKEGPNVMSRMGYAANDDDGESKGGPSNPLSSPLQRVAVANPYANNAGEGYQPAASPTSPVKEGMDATKEGLSNDDDSPIVDAAVLEEKVVEASKEREDQEEEATFSGNPEDNHVATVVTEEIATGADEAENDGDNAAEVASAKPAEDGDGAQTSRSADGETADEKKNDVKENPNADGLDSSKAPFKAEGDVHEEPVSEPAVVESLEKPTEIETEDAWGDKNNENPPEVTNANTTQETLTLLESQLDGVEMDYIQGGRFSQVSAGGTEGDQDDCGFSRSQNGCLSQVMVAAEGDTCEEEKEEAKRFSQYTQGSAAAGPVFEEEEGNEGNAETGDSGGDPLGQTMDSQLSME